jgi:hypothetical protein
MTFQEAIMTDGQYLSDYLSTTPDWDMQDYIKVDGKKAPFLYISEEKVALKRYKSIEKDGLIFWGDHGWLLRVQTKSVKFHYIVYLGSIVNPEKVKVSIADGRVNIDTGEVQ